MAGVAPSSSGGRRTRRRPLAEINVTPFVDVMLVLLIIFMVTAPLLNPAIPVDLPQSKAQPVSENREPLSITVKKDGSIFLMNKPVAAEDLVVRLTAIAQNGVDERIYVRGDTSVAYGRVIEVMGILNAAGFTKVGLVTGPPKAQQNPDETR
jgi:biopolymer transport protein TolR